MATGAGMNARGVVEVIIALTGLRLGVLNTGCGGAWSADKLGVGSTEQVSR
ncbi:hypothetical protein [Plantactinospora sp. DSM 117369]